MQLHHSRFKASSPRKDFIPEVEQEVVIGCAETRDDVIFGGTDATFCCVGAVASRENFLDGDSFVEDVGVDDVATLIVKDIEGWGKSSGEESAEARCVGSELGLCSAVFHGQ